MSFVGRIQALISRISVPWLRRRNMGAFLESIGLTYDSALETLAQGVQLSRPLDCDPSALPYIAADRGMLLFPTEPEESQRYRLAHWLQIRRGWGTHQGQLRALAPYFLPHTPRMRIVHQSGGGSPVATWHTLESDGTYTVSQKSPSNWNWDGVPAKWSRYWVIVYVDWLPAQPTWDGGQLWDGGSVWDGLFTSDQIADMVSLILEARAPHTMLWGVIFTTDATAFDPTASVVTNGAGWSNLPGGNWGFTIDNITGKPTRLPGTVFSYDLGQG